MAVPFNFIAAFQKRFAPAEKLICYHCDERMSKRRAVMFYFDGVPRALCCHGCLAVLDAIAKNGLTDEYLRSKLHSLMPPNADANP
jgi:hypothetical protein